MRSEGDISPQLWVNARTVEVEAHEMLDSNLLISHSGGKPLLSGRFRPTASNDNPG